MTPETPAFTPSAFSGLPGEQLWALGGLGILGDGVVVDELAARLVERGDEAGLALEGPVHHVVVLALHVQYRPARTPWGPVGGRSGNRLYCAVLCAVP